MILSDPPLYIFSATRASLRSATTWYPPRHAILFRDIRDPKFAAQDVETRCGQRAARRLRSMICPRTRRSYLDLDQEVSAGSALEVAEETTFDVPQRASSSRTRTGMQLAWSTIRV